MKIKLPILTLLTVLVAGPAFAEETAPVSAPAPVAAPLLAPAAAPAAEAKTTVLVLTERKNTDELISDADVTLIEMAKPPKDAILEPEQLIGKAARHPINPDQPIRPIDLKPFVVVKKGEMVTIELQTPNMNLTASGKSLDNGAQGQAVRVMNLASNKTIFAKVVGPNRVKVESAQ